jgi:hypothetical protein
MRSFLLCGLLALALPVMPALAASNGDMFSDNGQNIVNRPWIPGDRMNDYDMFPSAQPYMGARGDMFRSVPVMQDTELNAPLPAPETRNIFGGVDMFQAHPGHVPDSPLFHWHEGADQR